MAEPTRRVHGMTHSCRRGLVSFRACEGPVRWCQKYCFSQCSQATTYWHSRQVMDDHFDALFRSPFKAKQVHLSCNRTDPNSDLLHKYKLSVALHRVGLHMFKRIYHCLLLLYWRRWRHCARLQSSASSGQARIGMGEREGYAHTLRQFSSSFCSLYAAGDVFVFSGGCAHMALCLTTKQQPLSVTCYEVWDCRASVRLEIMWTSMHLDHLSLYSRLWIWTRSILLRWWSVTRLFKAPIIRWLTIQYRLANTSFTYKRKLKLRSISSSAICAQKSGATCAKRLLAG